MKFSDPDLDIHPQLNSLQGGYQRVSAGNLLPLQYTSTNKINNYRCTNENHFKSVSAIDSRPQLRTEHDFQIGPAKWISGIHQSCPSVLFDLTKPAISSNCGWHHLILNIFGWLKVWEQARKSQF